jgi:hypothetical protein
MTRFSVITLVYNAGNLVGAAIEGDLARILQDSEIVDSTTSAASVPVMYREACGLCNVRRR